MRRESIALLDVRSYDVTFLIAAKGVNGTFVFYDSKTENHDGFSTDGFEDVDSFRAAVASAVSKVFQNHKGKIKEVRVGVPSAFCRICTKGHAVSYPKRRRITAADVDYLYDSGLADLALPYRYISRSQMYFALGDNRKCFEESELYGSHTESLKGALCYYFVDETFYQTIEEILKKYGVEKTEYIPVTKAEARYLLPLKTRQDYTFLLDLGYVTTSLSTVYGNGIARESTYDFGVGSVLADLIANLNVDFDTAMEMLDSFGAVSASIPVESSWQNSKGESFPAYKIAETISNSVNGFCQYLDEFFQKYCQDTGVLSVMEKPLYITGEGLDKVRGFGERISKTLNRPTESVQPDLPFFDKPYYSSRISLLAEAFSSAEKKNGVNKLFQLLGGRK